MLVQERYRSQADVIVNLVLSINMKLCLLICVVIAGALGKKADQCPHPGRLGICAELCVADTDCDSGLLCCSNGCGTDCMVPVEVHAGSCPKPSRIFGKCVILPDNCSSDASCASDEKCCRERCNNVCKKAV